MYGVDEASVRGYVCLVMFSVGGRRGRVASESDSRGQCGWRTSSYEIYDSQVKTLVECLSWHGRVNMKAEGRNDD